jgi:hypothetical protein
MKHAKIALASLSILTILSSCAPAPRAKLTEFQRKADMNWLLSQIETNYAPLEYKQKLHHIDYEKLKDHYLDDAAKDQSNEEFYRLMFKLVAEFKDGHFSAGLSMSSLPGRSTVTYLGFSGLRKGENFKVTKFLPTFKDAKDYPIKINDEIIEMDGLSMREAVNQQLVPMRNIGNNESNFTGLVGKLFSRSSMNFPVTKEGMTKIKLKRGDKILTVEVPWITRDYVEFNKEQAEATAKKAQEAGSNLQQQMAEIIGMVQSLGGNAYISDTHIKNMLIKAKDATELKNLFLQTASRLTALDTFEYKRMDPVADVLDLYEILGKKFETGEEKKVDPKAPVTNIDLLKKERFVPAKIIPIAASKTYPAYVGVFEANKKRSTVGYIRLSTFSPEGSEDDVVKEFKATLNSFRDFGENGVDKIIIDMLNNGGGSLGLGIRLAQALSHDQIKLPQLTMRLNDAWMDSLEGASLKNDNDAKAEISRMGFASMLKAFQRGERMSPVIDMINLYPFSNEANLDLAIFDQPYKPKIVALVNEMCASMCDIFSSILRDNKLATLVGKQTMGAGGNVVQHAAAPNSGLQVNVTESLIISPNGDYLENNGVKPDVQVEVTNSADLLYKEVIEKAVETLNKDSSQT